MAISLTQSAAHRVKAYLAKRGHGVGLHGTSTSAAQQVPGKREGHI
jgi:hypothetical protein